LESSVRFASMDDQLVFLKCFCGSIDSHVLENIDNIASAHSCVARRFGARESQISVEMDAVRGIYIRRGFIPAGHLARLGASPTGFVACCRLRTGVLN